MPITLTNATADNDALAADYNANLQSVRDKFSATASVGIGNADIATDAGIDGTKLSTTNQVPEDRLLTDAVTSRVLRKDAVTSANRAVTNDHVQDGTLTKRAHTKTVGSSFSRAELDLTVQSVAFSGSVGVGAAVMLFRKTVGPNYAFGLTGSTATITVTPSTALPTATTLVLEALVENFTLVGAIAAGNLIIISIPLT